MKKQHRNHAVLSDTKAAEPAKEELDSSWSRVIRRRKFLQGLGAAATRHPELFTDLRQNSRTRTNTIIDASFVTHRARTRK